jgi:small conductance mechanosensitive channel
MDNFQVYWNQLIGFFVLYTPKLLLAIIVLIAGLWLIKRLVKLLDKLMERREVDKSLHSFIDSLAGVILKILLLLTVISMVGVETTSFIAILASVGFAIGMALQGSLGNFAGGVLILFLKPFKVYDYIEAQGFAGTVQSIQIFHTILLTPDNKRIIIPNGALSNNAIINYTAEAIRRLDLSFGIGYQDNVDNAKALIDKVIKADARILLDPAPMIAVGLLADSSVNFTVRVWCNTDDYWKIFFDIHEKMKKEFDENGISIPFPQRDIHIYNH